MNHYDAALHIIKTLGDHGFVAYFAGGWVRDHVMGNDSNDIDIATDAKPEKIVELFSKTILVGASFGVVVVVIEGHHFEVATFRKDFDYIGGRRPDKIEYCSAREDALRRDFTINGLFYDPIKHEIYDYVDGVRDIKEGLIRTIGSPHERFVEDRLRMIRAFRFSSRFGFFVDLETQEAIRENADTLFPAVSIERVWQEFSKMASYPHFDLALIEMHRLELLPAIFPKLAGEHLNEVKRKVLYFEHFPKKTPAIIYLAHLFIDDTLDEILEMCRYLKVSRRDIKILETFYQAKELVAKEKKMNGFYEVIEWVRFFAKNDAFFCLEIVVANMCDEDRKRYLEIHKKRRLRFESHVHRIAQRLPLISGDRLKELGISPGVKMGDLLDKAERLAVMHDLHDSEAVLEKLKETALWQEFVR